MKLLLCLMLLMSCIARAEIGSVLAEIVSINGELRSGTILIDMPIILVAQPQPDWEASAAATPNEVLYGWAVKSLPLFRPPDAILVYPVQ